MEERPLAEPMVDPVCGMKVVPDGPHHHDHGGVAYRFCSARCLARFREDPARFLSAAPHVHEPVASTPASATSTPRRYTCPMHPEIARDAEESAR